MTRTRASRILGVTLVIATLTLLIFPRHARAGVRTDTVRAIANLQWNFPCGGNWQLISGPLPQGMNGKWDPATPCTVYVRPFSQVGYYMWCAGVVHEVGHVAGQPHSEDPNSIMYPDLPTPTFYLYPPCKEDPVVKTTAHALRGRRFDSRSS